MWLVVTVWDGVVLEGGHSLKGSAPFPDHPERERDADLSHPLPWSMSESREVTPAPRKSLPTLSGPGTSASPSTPLTDVAGRSENAERGMLLHKCSSDSRTVKPAEGTAETQTLMGQVGDGA